MDTKLMIYLIIGLGILIFIILMFILAFRIKLRKVKKSKRLFCEIYLKKGGRDLIIKSVDDDSFDVDKGKLKTTYMIVKEAIQEEFSIGRLFMPNITRYIQFDEDIALPFISGFMGKEKTKQYMGSEKLNQFLKTKIWEEVGGINQSPMNMTTIIIVLGVILMIGFIAFVLLRK